MGNCFTNHSARSTKNVNKPTHVGNDLNFSTLLANEAVKIEEDGAQPGFSNEVKQKINKFFKDCVEVEDWLNTQLTVASSEDYGKDLDDVELLIQNFDIFLGDLYKVRSQIHNQSRLFAKIIKKLCLQNLGT